MQPKLATLAMAFGLSLGSASASVCQETESYSYDASGRLVTVTRADGNVISYSYDNAGNRVQVGGGGPPTANPDPVTTPRNTTLTFNPRSNDTDPNGDTLTIVSVTTPGHGAATIISSGTQIQYVPATSYAGSDSFSYTISDGNGNSASATVTVVVQGPPAPANDTIVTPLNTAKTFDPRNNDTDPNGDALSISAKTNGAHGAVTINAGASLTYTPSTGYTGADTFNYTVSDGQGGSATASVGVTVTAAAANQNPDAVNDSRTAQKDTVLTFDPRTNDTDPDSNGLTIATTSTPSHGSVSIVSGATQLSYTPSTGYVGSDSFTYTLSDGQGGSDTATVMVSVNGPPVAATDTQTTSTNTALTFDPRTNDTDPDGDTLAITAKTNGTNGAVTFTGTSVTYTPTTSYSGADSFTYTVSDGRGAVATGTVNMTVSGNQAPVANADSTDADAYYAGVGVGVYPKVTFSPQANDTDADGDTLTITGVTQGAGGTVTFTGSSVTYTYSIRYFPTGLWAENMDSDSFTYTISDGHGHTATATVNINVVVW